MTATVTVEELTEGRLPRVCARTGDPTDELAPVWFATTPAWSWAPLGGLLVLVVVTRSLAPLVLWWVLLPAVALPLATSRGVTGAVPLDGAVRARIAQLRRRRLRLVISALLLTWVAVAAWLLGARGGALAVAAVVLGLYAAAVWAAVAGRLASVGGVPHRDGTVTLTRVHPRFVAAVEARHRS